MKKIVFFCIVLLSLFSHQATEARNHISSKLSIKSNCQLFQASDCFIVKCNDFSDEIFVELTDDDTNDSEFKKKIVSEKFCYTKFAFIQTVAYQKFVNKFISSKSFAFSNPIFIVVRQLRI